MVGADRPEPAAAPRRRALLAALLAAAGCALLEAEPGAPPFAVVRGERSVAAPAEPVVRVLVLPMRAREAPPGREEALRRALAQALRELSGFEVVAPEPAELPRGTREQLEAGRADDVQGLIRLRRDWGADAVLFSELASSRAHGEPSASLALELVDARDGARLWRAAGVVDARDPDTRESLRSHAALETGRDPEDVEPAQVPLESFARFVARSFVRTLHEPRARDFPESAARSPAGPREVPGTVFPSAADR